MIRALIPLAKVRNVPRSIAFYEKLGFRVEKTFTPEGRSEPSWASLQTERAELMISAGGEAAKSVLFYLFCDDVAKEHARLNSAGIAVGDIRFEFYAPRGEFQVEDPDGYILMISHT
jgi:predicted enzyme related to lactoylglutathione lyase